MRLASLAAFVVVGLSTAGFADPVAFVRPKDVAPDPCGYPGDSMVLTIRDGKRELTSLDYCSAYGFGSATVVTDARGEHWLLREFGEGHGTNARSDYLAIYHLEELEVEYARVPISGAASSGSRWVYAYVIEKPRQGGLEIILRLRVDAQDGGEVLYKPVQAMRSIRIGP